MALQPILPAEEVTKLPEPLQKEYVKHDNDGKLFRLDVTPKDGWGLEDVGGLKGALQKERTDRQSLEQQVLKFKDIDPDKAREALGKLNEMANWDPDKKLQEARQQLEQQIESKYKTTYTQLENKWKTELESKDKTIQEQEAALNDSMIRNDAAHAIREKKGSVELLLPVVTAFSRLKRDADGKRRVVIVNDKGETRVSMLPGNRDDMTIEEFVEELRGKEGYARAFDPAANGSGAGGSTSEPRTTGNVIELTAEQAKDVSIYRRARDQAEKEGKRLAIVD